jgi:hypothetical protein
VKIDPRAELLASLERNLDALISGLGSRVPEESLVGLWSACDETFERFKAVHQGRADEALSDDLRRRMEGVFRLQVVVSSLAARLREELTVESEKVANARARLASLASRAHAGESCDLLG